MTPKRKRLTAYERQLFLAEGISNFLPAQNTRIQALQKNAPQMFLALQAVSNLVNSESFHDETLRLKVWSKVDEVLRKARGDK